MYCRCQELNDLIVPGKRFSGNDLNNGTICIPVDAPVYVNVAGVCDDDGDVAEANVSGAGSLRAVGASL